MSDREADERQSARLLTALIWGGVGLAPIAVIVLLIGGSDNSLRFANLLLAIAVVLIGASLLIRNDPVLLRMDVEDRLADLERRLRSEIRAEMGAPSRVDGTATMPVVPPPVPRQRGAGTASVPRATASVRPVTAEPQTYGNARPGVYGSPAQGQAGADPEPGWYGTDDRRW